MNTFPVNQLRGHTWPRPKAAGYIPNVWGISNQTIQQDLCDHNYKRYHDFVDGQHASRLENCFFKPALRMWRSPVHVHFRSGVSSAGAPDTGLFYWSSLAACTLIIK